MGRIVRTTGSVTETESLGAWLGASMWGEGAGPKGVADTPPAEVRRETPGVAGVVGVVGLDGDLGVGKTAFVRGLVRGLGGDPNAVHSPTFTLLVGYDLPGGRKLWHLDAYRASGPGEFEGIGFDELLAGAAGAAGSHRPGEGDVIAIEWAGRVEELMPGGAVRVLLEAVSPSERRIEIEVPAVGNGGEA